MLLLCMYSSARSVDKFFIFFFYQVFVGFSLSSSKVPNYSRFTHTNSIEVSVCTWITSVKISIISPHICILSGTFFIWPLRVRPFGIFVCIVCIANIPRRHLIADCREVNANAFEYLVEKKFGACYKCCGNGKCLVFNFMPRNLCQKLPLLDLLIWKYTNIHIYVFTLRNNFTIDA